MTFERSGFSKCLDPPMLPPACSLPALRNKRMCSTDPVALFSPSWLYQLRETWGFVLLPTHHLLWHSPLLPPRGSAGGGTLGSLSCLEINDRTDWPSHGIPGATIGACWRGEFSPLVPSHPAAMQVAGVANNVKSWAPLLPNLPVASGMPFSTLACRVCELLSLWNSAVVQSWGLRCHLSVFCAQRGEFLERE